MSEWDNNPVTPEYLKRKVLSICHQIDILRDRCKGNKIPMIQVNVPTGPNAWKYVRINGEDTSRCKQLIDQFHKTLRVY